MPTYEYACKQCEERLEVVQKFTDEPLVTCPECSGPLRKVFGSVGISFKGSGFYKTDSRSKGKSSSDSSSKTSEGSSTSSDSGSSTSEKSSDKSGDKSTDKKADAPKPAASTSTGSAAAS